MMERKDVVRSLEGVAKYKLPKGRHIPGTPFRTPDELSADARVRLRGKKKAVPPRKRTRPTTSKLIVIPDAPSDLEAWRTMTVDEEVAASEARIKERIAKREAHQRAEEARFEAADHVGDDYQGRYVALTRNNTMYANRKGGYVATASTPTKSDRWELYQQPNYYVGSGPLPEPTWVAEKHLDDDRILQGTFADVMKQLEMLYTPDDELEFPSAPDADIPYLVGHVARDGFADREIEERAKNKRADMSEWIEHKTSEIIDEAMNNAQGTPSRSSTWGQASEDEKAEYERVSKMPEPTVEDIEKQVIAQIRTTLQSAPNRTYVFVPNHSVLQQILMDGRMKSQFESGNSGGMYAPDMRSDFESKEAKHLNVPDTIDKRVRPIYGALEEDTERFSEAKRYGAVALELNPDRIKDRLTVTLGDSLDHNLTGVTPTESDPDRLLTATAMQTLQEMTERAVTDYYEIEDNYPEGSDEDSWGSDLYNEIQVHGGVTLRDIDTVMWAYSPYDDETADSNISKRWLDKAGIRYYTEGQQW